MKYIVRGGNKLHGEVKISGNKNSILPCMAAALLTDEEVTLENVPDISDVKVYLEIFDELGVKYQRDGRVLKVKADRIKSSSIPDELAVKLRASILFAGPLLSVIGKVDFSFPGGDVIGRRTINPHLDGFKSLGFTVKSSDLKFKISGSFKKNVIIFLEEASVMATENLILASVLGNSRVKIRNCASEPQVVDLCNLLNSMGAQIEGIGSDVITIQGVEKLHGTKFRIGSDYIEIATYAIASFITGGDIKILCTENLDLQPIEVILNKFGLNLNIKDEVISIDSGNITSVPVVKTNIWPGFPTDLMSAVIVLATQARGITLCHDWMYESRMFFVDKLIAMGANITIADPHRVLVSGPSKLYGRIVDTPDIRAGMALVLASLVADGETIIDNVELIERGYEDVVGKLKKLGVDIKRVD